MTMWIIILWTVMALLGLALAYIGYGLYKTNDYSSPYFMKLLKPFL